MTIAVTIAGAATNRKYGPDQFDAINIEISAFDAEIGVSQVPVPDPAGTDAAAAGRNVLIVDGTTTFLDGFISSQGRDRGPTVTPPNRLSVYSVQDANVLLYGMLVENWARPAETDRARVLAAAAAFWPTLNTTWVLATADVTLPAKTYDTADFISDLSADLIEASGKTIFVRSAGGTRYLHYHALAEGPAAAFSLDDTPGAANYSTVFDFTEPHRDSDGLDLKYRISARGANGAKVTVADATSEAAHGADGRKYESLVDFPDAADVTELTALANRLLAAAKDERETFTVRIGPLTAAQAAGIGPGFQISVTSGVLGLTAATKRIAHLAWAYDHPGRWYATVELGMPIRSPKGPRGTPGLPPCGDAEGTTLNGTTDGQRMYLFGGVQTSAVGFNASGFATSSDSAVRVGYDWNKVVEILGYACPGGLQYDNPQEFHAVWRFDTRALAAGDCSSGARLKFVVSPDCACGPYELVTGAYFSSNTPANLTLARFRQGKVIGAIDLSHASDAASPSTFDLPRSAINWGGWTDIGIRPRWRHRTPIACSAVLPAGDQYGSLHCSTADADITLNHLVNTPEHWLQPGNVHSAALDGGLYTPTLLLLSVVAGGCLTAWADAVCATTADYASVPADNCADPCCAIWWKVPCGAYKPGTLEVSVGGRVLKRGRLVSGVVKAGDYVETANRKVFRLAHGSCETPRVRYEMAGS